jgi:hypothetical protein
MARRVIGIHREERIASLVAAAGVIWAVSIATSAALPVPALPAGPVEACSVGVVLWLHAKWRRSLKVH